MAQKNISKDYNTFFLVKPVIPEQQHEFLSKSYQHCDYKINEGTLAGDNQESTKYH